MGQVAFLSIKSPTVTCWSQGTAGLAEAEKKAFGVHAEHLPGATYTQPDQFLGVLTREGGAGIATPLQL